MILSSITLNLSLAPFGLSAIRLLDRQSGQNDSNQQDYGQAAGQPAQASTGTALFLGSLPLCFGSLPFFFSLLAMIGILLVAPEVALWIPKSLY